MLVNDFEDHCRVVDAGQGSDFPTVWIKAKFPKTYPYILAGCYREWGNEAQKSIEEQINRQIKSAVRCNGELCIVGDINLNYECFGDRDWDLKRVAERFVELCEKNNLKIRDKHCTYPKEKDFKR